jgi:isocitrate dehydrogenase
MEEKINYRFDHSNGILYKYYQGNITIEDISSSWEYAIENKLIPKETKGFILDYRKATFKIKITEYQLIADFYKNHLEVFGHHKIAILVENPKDVVIPILVESKDDGYSSRPFNTLNAAIGWVLS